MSHKYFPSSTRAGYCLLARGYHVPQAKIRETAYAQGQEQVFGKHGEFVSLKGVAVTEPGDGFLPSLRVC